MIDCFRDKSGSADSCPGEVKDSNDCTFQFDDGLSEYNTVEEKTCSSVNQKLVDAWSQHNVQERHAVGKVQRQDWSD